MDVIQYLVDLRDSQTELIIKSIEECDNQIIVDLKDSEGNFLSQKITRLAQFSKVDLTPTPLGSIEPPSIAGKKFLVTNKKMLERDGIIWCIEERVFKDFCEMQKSLNEYASRLSAETYGAKVHDLCLVKVKNQWYRASIIEMKGDGFPYCLLLDLGEFFKIPIENIFVLPKVFARYPMYSLSLEIHNYLAEDDSTKKYLKEYVAENTFIVANDVKETQNGLVIYFNPRKV